MEDSGIAGLIRAGADVIDLWFGRLIELVGGGELSFLLAAGIIGLAVGLILGRKTKTASPHTEPLLLGGPRAVPPPSPISEETGVTDAMLDVLRGRLREWGTAPEDFEDRLVRFAVQYRDMAAALGASLSDSGVGDAATRAKALLDTGDVAAAIQALGQAGEDRAAGGIKLKKDADDSMRNAGAAYLLAGDLYLAQDAYQDAMRHYRNAIDTLPPTADRLLAEALNKCGTAAFQSGNIATAMASFEHALKVLEKTLGPDHEDVAASLNNLGLIHYSQDEFGKAEPLYRRALEIDEKVFGPESPTVATDLNNLALLCKKKGDLAQAETLFKRSIFIKERVFDPGHPSLATGLRNYAALLKALGRDAEARIIEGRASVAA